VNGLYGKRSPERNVLVSGGALDKRGECMGCLSVVNTAASAIFTEGAWVGGVDGKLELV
jgi:hypothetical protein